MPGEVAPTRRDLTRYPDDPQHAAAAMALQLYGGMDPDRSRYVALHVVRAIQRAGVRPTDGLPTEAEIRRARMALMRRAIEVERDDVYAALFDALVESPDADLTSDRGLVEESCGICGLEGPDEFGNYELIPDPACPIH
jgi:hypothetical protein